MLKAVFFDFDGVLTTDKSGSLSIAKSLARRSGLPADRIRAVYGRYNGRMLVGELEPAQMWDAFCAELGADMPIGWLTEAAKETPLDQEMLGLVRELRGRCKVGMITDNPASRVAEILELHGLCGLFDVISVSGAIGSRKDRPEIFRRTLDAAGLPAEACLFIDNTAANLLIPQSLGMKVHLFDDEKRDIEALRETLGNLFF